MTGLLFEHPEWTSSALLLLCGVALATAFAQARARRRLRVLLGSPGRLQRGAFQRDLLLLLALTAGVVALLGPRIGERSVLVSTRGADVVFLIDVSRSMDARDVAPSRIGRARQAVSELLERLEAEDRASLAAFAGRGVLLTPLTPDSAALREMLPALDTSLIRPGASDLAAGVRSALEAFELASDRPRVIVVFSDGESTDRDMREVATAAVRLDTRVLSAALGTDPGATITHQGSELRDSTGHVVITRRRLEPLEVLAKTSGGVLFSSDEFGRFDLEQLAREIGRDARGEPGDLVERRVAAPMVLPFAALAFALLLVEWLPIAGWRPSSAKLSRVLGRTAASSMMLAIALVPQAALEAREAPQESSDGAPEQTARPERVVEVLEATARARPLAARELLLLGVARARLDRWQEAQNSFMAAAIVAEDPEIAALAYHDLGVAALRQDELERARGLFFDSLALRPDNVETRFNLEWTIAALDVKPPAEPPAPLQAPNPQSDAKPNEDTPPQKEAAPDPQPPALPQPANEPEESDDPKDRAPQKPPELSEAQRERWINRIEDDPSKALRSAARGDQEERRARKRDRPAW